VEKLKAKRHLSLYGKDDEDEEQVNDVIQSPSEG
jgi:hypothetical protein